jgi:D-aminoacyl-tRNA deacylase
MKVVLQRCKTASVKVDKKIVGQINRGLLILVGFTSEDDITNIPYMVDKIINLRIFDDENGVMNKSLLDTKGEILSVSQFTLYADTKKGRRPSYVDALAGDKAIKLYEKFNEEFTKYNIVPQTGIFGADMEVSLINDGPVTIIIEK